MRKAVEPCVSKEDWREVLVCGTIGFGFEVLQDEIFGAAIV